MTCNQCSSSSSSIDWLSDWLTDWLTIFSRLKALSLCKVAQGVREVGKKILGIYIYYTNYTRPFFKYIYTTHRQCSSLNPETRGVHKDVKMGRIDYSSVGRADPARLRPLLLRADANAVSSLRLRFHVIVIIQLWFTPSPSASSVCSFKFLHRRFSLVSW